MTPERKSKSVKRFENSNDVIVIDRKKTVILSDEKENLVKTTAKERKDRKTVSTPLKTPGKEVKAHTKGGRGSQVKSLKRGKKTESLEDTAKRLKLVKLKNVFERKSMGETIDNLDENAVTPVELGKVGVSWAVASSTVRFGATICVDQSEGATQTSTMSHLGFGETGRVIGGGRSTREGCDWLRFCQGRCLDQWELIF
jgi:transposase